MCNVLSNQCDKIKLHFPSAYLISLPAKFFIKKIILAKKSKNVILHNWQNKTAVISNSKQKLIRIAQFSILKA